MTETYSFSDKTNNLEDLTDISTIKLACVFLMMTWENAYHELNLCITFPPITRSDALPPT